VNFNKRNITLKVVKLSLYNAIYIRFHVNVLTYAFLNCDTQNVHFKKIYMFLHNHKNFIYYNKIEEIRICET